MVVVPDDGPPPPPVEPPVAARVDILSPEYVEQPCMKGREEADGRAVGLQEDYECRGR